jgi:hypothetical protein
MTSNFARKWRWYPEDIYRVFKKTELRCQIDHMHKYRHRTRVLCRNSGEAKGGESATVLWGKGENVICPDTEILKKQPGLNG